MLAEDLADRMRGDRAGAIANDYLGTYSANAAPATGAPPATQNAMSDWAARLAELPGATATVSAVTLVGATAYTVTIEVDWVDTRANAAVGSNPTSASFAAGKFVLPTEI